MNIGSLVRAFFVFVSSCDFSRNGILNACEFHKWVGFRKLREGVQITAVALPGTGISVFYRFVRRQHRFDYTARNVIPEMVVPCGG